jgi:hypothetical protein
MSHTTLPVPGMNNLPGRYDVTVRVAGDDYRHDVRYGQHRCRPIAPGYLAGWALQG